MRESERVEKAEAILGHHFSRRRLIVSAITHPSAVEGRPVSDSYERLEFLGDSILGAIVAEELFERFPEMDEGGLTRLKTYLVSGETLSEVAGGLGVGEVIVFGDSERGTQARGLHHALENVYEALVGALYLDAGATEARRFVLATLGPRISADMAKQSVSPKSRLQEFTQRELKCAPVYKLVGEAGPSHKPTFTSVVLVAGRRMGRGVGATKKESESAAAEAALEALEAEEGKGHRDASEARPEASGGDTCI